MTQFFLQFSRGFRTPFDGAKTLIESRTTLLYALIPFLVCTLMFLGGLYWGYGPFVGSLVGSLTGHLPNLGWFSTVVSAIVHILSSIAALTLLFVGVYIVLSVVCGPFLALMTEDILQRSWPDWSAKGSAGLILRMFFLSMVKAVFFVALSLVCFVLTFLPPLNIVGSFLLLLMVSFDCMDYAFEADFMRLGQRFQFFLDHFPYFLGTAVALSLMAFVPGLLFIMLPACVAGGARLFVDLRSVR